MNYKQLKTLYKKEIMDVIRDKKTIFTMVVLPVILYPLLFLVIMQVISMINTSQQERTYKVVYDNVADADVEALEDWIKGDEDGFDYKIKKSKVSDVKKALDDEEIDAYITTKVTGSQIIYEVHYLSVVTNSSTVKEMLEDEIDSYAKHIAEKNVKEDGLDVDRVLYPVKSESKDRSSTESSVGNILGGIVPFLLITAILMGSMYPAIDTTAGEKERGTLETMLTMPVGNMELIMSKFLSVATISVVSVCINVLSMGGVAAYMFATIKSLSEDAGSFKVSTFVPAILISVVCVIAFALLMSAVVMCVCAFAKSFKEANNYVTPVTLVVMLTGYIGFIPNVELSSKTALIPVANVCLLIKTLMVFKYDFQLILIVLLSNVIYAFIAVWVLAKIYNSESILFGESLSGIKLFERRKNIKKGSTPTIQESLLVMIVALLIMVYVGGVMSLDNPLYGVIIPQLFIGLLPVLAAVYIKADLKEVFLLRLPSVRHFFGSLLLIVGTSSGVLIVANILAHFFPESNSAVNEGFGELISHMPFAVGLLLIAATPAVCEELMFRGYMFTAFKSKIKIPMAILYVSILFGLNHMSLIRFIPTMLLGLALCYAAYKTKSLLCSSVMHFFNNSLSVITLYYGDEIAFLNDEKNAKPVYAALIAAAVICIPLGLLVLKDKKQKSK
jgi:sodium transport system permease protein